MYSLAVIAEIFLRILETWTLTVLSSPKYGPVQSSSYISFLEKAYSGREINKSNKSYSAFVKDICWSPRYTVCFFISIRKSRQYFSFCSFGLFRVDFRNCTSIRATTSAWSNRSEEHTSELQSR